VENDKEEDNYSLVGVTMIKRQTLIAEELIREHIRSRITKKIESTERVESMLREAIREILQEAETGTEEPSTYTGINVLADLLKNIVPTIEDDYKMLTTSSEQRESFRNHIVHAIKNTLRPIEVTSATDDIDENMVFHYEPEDLLEKVTLDVIEDEPGDLSGEFIDIDQDDSEESFIQIDDQNETGRNFAAETFKAVEKQIVDAYDMLADDKDQDLFYDYLITNMLLYFDKFEDELANELPDVTTPEYEEEKNNETEEEAESMTSVGEEEEEELELDI
jgi:hypothetical protein